jgi:hypothetical protein
MIVLLFVIILPCLAMKLITRMSALPARAEWRAWLPITKPNTARFNANHHGTLAEWRQWVIGSKRWSSSASASGEKDVDETEDDDEWRRFQFGSFASRMSPTKQQNTQMNKIMKMAPPEIDPLWSHLTDDEIIRGIEAVSLYVTEERRSKFSKVLGDRTNYIRFVFENPINVNNCWACLRTLIHLVFSTRTLSLRKRRIQSGGGKQ